MAHLRDKSPYGRKWEGVYDKLKAVDSRNWKKIYMPTIQIEQRTEYKANIRRVIALNPTISVTELQRRLKTAAPPIELDYDYLRGLVKEIRADRIREVEEQTKEDLFAQISDVVEWVNNQLRAIAQEEKLVYTKTKDGLPAEKAEVRIFAQQNRIKALNSIVKNLESLINLKMDLGIIDRKLGTADFRVIDLMSSLEKIRNGDYTTPIENLFPKETVLIGGDAESGGAQSAA